MPLGRARPGHGAIRTGSAVIWRSLLAISSVVYRLTEYADEPKGGDCNEAGW